MQMIRHLPFLKLKHVFAKISLQLNMLDFVLSLLHAASPALATLFFRLLKSKMTQDCTAGNFLPGVSLSVRPWEGSVKLATERPLFCQTISQFLLLSIIIIIIIPTTLSIIIIIPTTLIIIIGQQCKKRLLQFG